MVVVVFWMSSVCCGNGGASSRAEECRQVRVVFEPLEDGQVNCRVLVSYAARVISDWNYLPDKLMLFCCWIACQLM